MGGWGTGIFENEEAQNFLKQLGTLAINVDDLRPILIRAADLDGYLEAPQSSAAVAAAEVVAALLAAAREETLSPSTPPQISHWIMMTMSKRAPGSSTDLIDLARRAVHRVRTNSELKDLWLEADGLNEWSAGLRDLETRLNPQK
jgi:hypothetical protein